MKAKKHGFALRLWWWLSLAAFIVCALALAYYLIQGESSRRNMEKMTAYVMGTEETTVSADAAPTVQPSVTPVGSAAVQPTAAPVGSAAVQPSVTPAASTAVQPTAAQLSPEEEARMERYRALAQENPDFIGWLCINDTRINDPVMYTPDDSQHYLNRGFDGGYSVSGQLFLDASCDAHSVPGNKIIYGHNMRDGSRFGELKRYLDESFLREQPVIQFDTLYLPGQYQVMAAFRLPMDDLKSPSMLCYRSIDTTDDAALSELCAYLDEHAVARAQGVYPQWGDELLTLSTCGRAGGNERVVVMARRVSAPAQAPR